MTAEQLMPTPGFVLPSIESIGGGPRGAQGKAKKSVNKTAKEAKEKQAPPVDASGKETAPSSGTATGTKRKRTTPRTSTLITGPAQLATETDGLVLDPQLEASSFDMTSTLASAEESCQSTNNQASHTQDNREPDHDEDADDHVEEQNQPGSKSRSRKTSSSKNPKRLRVTIRDDLTENDMTTLSPGEALGPDIDEESLTMADLASRPGRGRISGKAIKIQQSKDEIAKRREEEQARRIRYRVDREMKMRGVALGQVEPELEAEPGSTHGEGQAEPADIPNGTLHDPTNDQQGENDDDDDDDDIDMTAGPSMHALPSNRVSTGINVDIEHDSADDHEPRNELEDEDEGPDTHSYALTQNAIGLSYDESGNIILNNVVNRADILRDAMQGGDVFEENDDLKFTNSMSHSKRATTMRWTKDMKEKLINVSVPLCSF